MRVDAKIFNQDPYFALLGGNRDGQADLIIDSANQKQLLCEAFFVDDDARGRLLNVSMARGPVENVVGALNFDHKALITFGEHGITQQIEIDYINGLQFSLPGSRVRVESWNKRLIAGTSGVVNCSASVVSGGGASRGKDLTYTYLFQGLGTGGSRTPLEPIPAFARVLRCVNRNSWSASISVEFYAADGSTVLVLQPYVQSQTVGGFDFPLPSNAHFFRVFQSSGSVIDHLYIVFGLSVL